MNKVAAVVSLVRQFCRVASVYKQQDAGADRFGSQTFPVQAHPVFMYSGHTFSGFSDDYSALNLDPDGFLFAGGFSISFVALWDAIHGWSPVVDFWDSGEKSNIAIAVEEEESKTGAFILRVEEQGQIVEAYIPGAVQVGQASRFLCTVSSIGELSVYKDGDFIGGARKDGFKISSSPRRHMYVGKSFLQESHSFTGRVESLCIWREQVQWGDAEACNVGEPRIVPTAAQPFAGEEFQRQLRIPALPTPEVTEELTFTLPPDEAQMLADETEIMAQQDWRARQQTLQAEEKRQQHDGGEARQRHENLVRTQKRRGMQLEKLPQAPLEHQVASVLPAATSKPITQRNAVHLEVVGKHEQETQPGDQHDHVEVQEKKSQAAQKTRQQPQQQQQHQQRGQVAEGSQDLLSTIAGVSFEAEASLAATKSVDKIMQESFDVTPELAALTSVRPKRTKSPIDAEPEKRMFALDVSHKADVHQISFGGPSPTSDANADVIQFYNISSTGSF